MYQLKQIPEDFVVKEISLLDFQRKILSADTPSRGKYLYFQLRKKNKNTLEAVQALARAWSIPEKCIGFAGSKDKRAVTEQVCSVLCAGREKFMQKKIMETEIRDMHLIFLGFGDTPISLGDLQSNAFEIIIRNLEDREIPRFVSFIPNYFDEQRFGNNNIALGKCLLKKNFSEAVNILKNERCKEYLLPHPHDYVGALKTVPLRLLRLYLNAYQSYLWNETLAGFLRGKSSVAKEISYSQGKFIFSKDIFPELEIPIIGFDYARKKNEKTEEIIASLMQKEEITPEDFIIKQIPQLTLEGEMRKAFVDVNDLVIGNAEEDEFHAEKKKVKVSFVLSKGSYATMAIRAMMAITQ